MSNLEYLYIPMEGDKESVFKNLDELRKRSNQELVDSCNRQVKMGVVGARAQMLYLVALRIVMKERFGHSPIYVKDKYILGLEGEVKLVGNDYCVKAVSPKVQLEWVSIPEVEKQTIIHCTHHAERRFILGGWINIHPNTCLMNDQGLGVLPLEYAIGVPLAPDKHLYNGYDESLKFTLVFKGIPANWLSFTLVEKAEEGEEFCIRNIKRNGVGVYYVHLNSEV